MAKLSATGWIDRIELRAVTNGMELLDEIEPGWIDRIELDTLDIADMYRCVLGQLFGEYGIGSRKIEKEKGKVFDDPGDYGFVHWLIHPYSEKGLTAVWKREIKRRRDEKRS